MNKNQLDLEITRIRGMTLPTCPAHLENTVIRLVGEEQRTAAKPAFWGELAALVYQPRMATAIFAFSIALGAVTTTVASQVAAPVEKRPASIGLEALANPHALECHHVDSHSTTTLSKHH